MPRRSIESPSGFERERPHLGQYCHNHHLVGDRLPSCRNPRKVSKVSSSSPAEQRHAVVLSDRIRPELSSPERPPSGGGACVESPKTRDARHRSVRSLRSLRSMASSMIALFLASIDSGSGAMLTPPTTPTVSANATTGCLAGQQRLVGLAEIELHSYAMSCVHRVQRGRGTIQLGRSRRNGLR